MARDREGRSARGVPDSRTPAAGDVGTAGNATGGTSSAQGQSSFYARAAERRSQRGSQTPLPGAAGSAAGREYGAGGEQVDREPGAYSTRGQEYGLPSDVRAGGFEGAHGSQGSRGPGNRYGSATFESASGRGASWNQTRDVTPRTGERESTGAGLERDLSAPLGMGYRDFGEGRGGTGEKSGREAQRRARWQREPATAREVMTKNPKAVSRNARVEEIARVMREEDTGIVPVVDENGKLLGVVTDRDIVVRTVAEGTNPLGVRASDIMTNDVEAVTPDESLREVIQLMGDRQIRRVPVVDKTDRLVGIISMGDVANRADYDEDLQDALQDISARRSFWSTLFR